MEEVSGGRGGGEGWGGGGEGGEMTDCIFSESERMPDKADRTLEWTVVRSDDDVFIPFCGVIASRVANVWQ